MQSHWLYEESACRGKCIVRGIVYADVMDGTSYLVQPGSITERPLPGTPPQLTSQRLGHRCSARLLMLQQSLRCTQVVFLLLT